MALVPARTEIYNLLQSLQHDVGVHKVGAWHPPNIATRLVMLHCTNACVDVLSGALQHAAPPTGQPSISRRVGGKKKFPRDDETHLLKFQVMS